MFPAARFVTFEGVEGRYSEYLVEGRIRQRDSLGDLPMASGPMRVDCQSVQEIGMIVRHANWKGSGYYHMYDFTLETEAAGAPQPNFIRYREMMSRGYIRGVIRFRQKPDNGVMVLSVLHRGEVLLTTEFDFVNCSA